MDELPTILSKGDLNVHLSSSSITGNSVRNAKGDDLGSIEDLMIDVQTGQTSYAVLSFGGFMGVGDKLFAVPLQAMRLDAKNKSFVLDASKESLENAPGFDKGHWPDASDSKWQAEVREYYKL